MSRITDILKHHRVLAGVTTSDTLSDEEAEQALLALIDEAIGPDELVGNGSSQWPWQRNQLRAEIRMGNRESGLKTYHTLVKRYGTTADGKSRHHSAIGRIGGSAPKTKPSGFKAHPGLAEVAGQMGGQISRRGATKLSQDEVDDIKSQYAEDLKLAREQSRMQVSSLSAKYGSRRPW